MFQRYSFFPIFLFLLAGLQWWAHRVESLTHVDPPPILAIPGVGPSKDTGKRVQIETSKRLDLVEALERIVAYEHYYRSVYGHFTKLVNRVGFKVPRTIGSLYDIRVVDATKDRLLVNAFSEVDGKTDDMLSIDQDYEVRANFTVPSPRAEYLRISALKHLRALYGAPKGQMSGEEGVFKDFFRYEVKDEDDKRVAFAVGVRAPVQGMQLEISSNNSQAENAYLDILSEDPSNNFSELAPSLTGQWSQGNEGTLEEAYLAQRIFRGETGRYAKNWLELSKITGFKFADKDRWGGDAVPFGDTGEIHEIDIPDSQLGVSQKASGQAPLVYPQGRAPAARSPEAGSRPALEIERIEENEITGETPGAESGAEKEHLGN